MSDGKAIFKQTCPKLETTLNNLIESHHQINQRATDLAKINVLSSSVVVSAFAATTSPPKFYLIFAAGIVLMLTSLAFCIQVYRPRTFHMGLGSGAFNEIQKGVSNGLSEKEHYRKVAIGLENAIQSSRAVYDREVTAFQRALWLTLGGVILIAIGSTQLVHDSFNSCIEYASIFLVVSGVIVVLYMGPRDMYKALS